MGVLGSKMLQFLQKNSKIYAKTIFKMSENIHRGDSYLFSENLAKEMYQIGRFVFVIQMNYQTS